MQPVDGVTQAKPLAVFAKLTQGESPVLDALIALQSQLDELMAKVEQYQRDIERGGRG